MTQHQEKPFATVLAALLTDAEVPIHQLHRLSDLSAEDFAHFKAQWTTVDEDRRVALARHMADIVEDNYLVDYSPIFAHLFNDRSAAVRTAALDGLWDSEDTDLVSPIINMMQTDSDLGVRVAAARTLAHYILLAEWGQIDPLLAESVVTALLAEYERPGVAPELQRATLEAVSPAGHPRIAYLIDEAYEEGDDDLQLSAIFAMGNTSDERWLPVLEAELDSPSPDFRAEAARACGMIGDPSIIDALEQLISDKEIEVGIAAIYAIGQIGGYRAVELLSALLEDPDYEEYYDAVEEALDEIDWMGDEFDFLAPPDDDEDDSILNDLRLN